MEINEIVELMNRSHSTYHNCENMAVYLKEKGFTELSECEKFNLKPEGKYFVRRNGTSLIAFVMNDGNKDIHFQVASSHLDSPTFKLKPKPVINGDQTMSLNVEPYGGMIMSTWLDRPLSIAGRVMVRENGKIVSRLFDVDRDLLFIPNVAIHMNREINNGYKYNPAVDLLPLLGMKKEGFDFNAFVKENLPTDGEVLSFDLALYNRDKARLVGLENEFLSAGRIDNLTSAYTSMIALAEAPVHSHAISMVAAFDNEEEGSRTRQGADSSFLRDTMERIIDVIGAEKHETVAKSMALSIDNAHAKHPNHPEFCDKTSPVIINKGVVIKHSAGVAYATDSLSSALVKGLAEKAGLAIQEFTNRPDMRGGSTLGNISNSQVALLSCDIGVAQYAMHSANEICGVQDVLDMHSLIKEFFADDVKLTSDSIEF